MPAHAALYRHPSMHDDRIGPRLSWADHSPTGKDRTPWWQVTVGRFTDASSIASSMPQAMLHDAKPQSQTQSLHIHSQLPFRMTLRSW